MHTAVISSRQIEESSPSKRVLLNVSTCDQESPEKSKEQESSRKTIRVRYNSEKLNQRRKSVIVRPFTEERKEDDETHHEV